MKLKPLLTAILVFCAAATARDMNVTVKGTPRTTVVGDVDSVKLDKRYPSNTVESFSIFGTSPATHYLLQDIDKVELGPPEGSSDTLDYLSVFRGADVRNYRLDDIDSITFDDLPAVDGGDDDSDGLSNFDELNRFMTDPKKADSDGDGWDDGKELGWFSPQADPRKFNPLIADLPSLEIEQVETPEIRMVQTVSETESEEVVVTEGGEFSSGYTQSKTFATSVGMEHGWELGFSQSFGQEGKDWKWEIGFEQSVHGSYTTESVNETGAEWSRENVSSFEQAETRAREQSREIAGGYVDVAINVLNNSNIAYTVKSMTLAAYSLNYSARKRFNFLGNLNLEDNDAVFQQFTLEPGSPTNAPMNFINSNLDYQTVRDWATRAHGLVLEVSGFKITMFDEDGAEKDFTHELTATAALTAKIRIDHGPGVVNKDPYELNVATLGRYNVNTTGPDDRYFPVTLADLLETARIPYEEGEYDGNHGLVSVDGVAHEPDSNGFWYVVLTDINDKVFSVLSVEGLSYSVSDLEVLTGEIVDVIYSKDSDQDGLPARLENVLGISDSDVDSDDDGLWDGEEVNGWEHDGDTVRTDPALADTDGDSIDDPTDPDPLRRPISSSVAIETLVVQQVGFSGDVVDTFYSASDPGATIEAPGMLADNEVDRVVTTAAPMYLVTLDGIPLQRDSTGLVYSGFTAVPYGGIELDLRVQSEDQTVDTTYTLSLTTSMPPLDSYELKLASDALSGLTSYNGFRVRFRWRDLGNDGYDGVLFLFSETRTSLEAYNPASLAMLPDTGSEVAPGVRVCGREGFGGDDATVVLDRLQCRFYTTHYVRPFTYRQESAGSDYELVAGAIKSVETTGRARVRVDLHAIHALTEEDQGANAEYIWTAYSHRSGGNDTIVYLPNHEYRVEMDVGDSVTFGSGGESSEPQTYTLEPGEAVTATIDILEIDCCGETSGDDSVGTRTLTLAYTGDDTPRTQNNSTIVGPRSTVYSTMDATDARAFRKLAQLNSDDGDLDVYWKVTYELVDTL